MLTSLQRCFGTAAAEPEAIPACIGFQLSGLEQMPLNNAPP